MTDNNIYDHWKDPEWLELFYQCHEDEWRQEAMEDYEIEAEEDYEIEAEEYDE